MKTATSSVEQQCYCYSLNHYLFIYLFIRYLHRHLQALQQGGIYITKSTVIHFCTQSAVKVVITW